MSRDSVYKKIDGEREYQDSLWECESHSVGDWIVFMEHYLNKAKSSLTTESGSKKSLNELRKVVALGVACFEQHGVPDR